MTTRQGENRGALPMTTASGSSGRGESSVITAFGAPATPVKYMPAQSVKLASVSATQAGPACTSSGHPMMSPGRNWLRVVFLNSCFLVADEGPVVRGPHGLVAVEVELGALGRELEVPEAGLLGQDVAEGDAVVEGPDDKPQLPFLGPGLLQREDQLVRLIPDLLRVPQTGCHVSSMLRLCSPANARSLAIGGMPLKSSRKGESASSGLPSNLTEK